MKTSVLDYNKRLADYRDRFNEDTQKMREAHKTALQNEIETHDAQRERQFDTYKKDVSEIRDTSDERIERSREKNAQELAKRRERYAQRLKEESEKFNEISKDRISDFRKQNERLRESFLKNQEQTEKFYDKNLENTKRNFENRISEINNNQQEQLNLLTNGVKSNSNDKDREFAKQKADLVSSYNQQLTEQELENLNEQSQLKESLGKELKLQKKNFEKISSQVRDNQTRNSLNQQRRFEQKYEDHKDFTEERIKEASVQRDEDERLLTKKFNRKISNLEDAQKKALDFERNKDSRFEQGSFEEYTAAKEKEIAEERLNHKINELNKINANLKDKMSDREVKLGKKAQNDIKRNSEVEKQKRLELEREFIETTMEQKARSSRKLSKVVDSFEAKVKEQERVANSQILSTQDKSKEQLQKLKENFNRSLSDVSFKSGIQVDSVKEQAEADKKAFLERVKEETTNEKLDMNRSHKRRMSIMQQNYEKKIANLEADNNKIKNQMNFAIQTLTQKNNDLMEAKEQFFDETRKADIRRFESKLISKDNEAKKNLQLVHSEYQKRMEDQRINNLNDLRNQSNDYEMKMKNQSRKFKQEITELVRNHQRLLQEKTNQLDIEKGQLITRYENEITRLKNLHQIEQDRVDKYQRLASQNA